MAKSMEVRVEKAVVEFRKNRMRYPRRQPDAVSKKTEETIKHMGVKPDPKMMERLAAQVVAYRIESRKAANDTAAGIMYERGGCVGGGARNGGKVRAQTLRKCSRS
jgi:hypothetical protein